VSWLTARDGGARAPLWLKVTTMSWLVGLFALLLGFYFAYL
jgi:hypothetical protein